MMHDWRTRHWVGNTIGKARPCSSVLYITYDGLMEPLGQSQVMPYLCGLSGDYGIAVLSFEKREDWENLAKRQAQQGEMHRLMMRWMPLRYHKRPSIFATAFDIAQGLRYSLAYIAQNKFGIVHVRSYVSGVIGLALKKAAGARLIFDMRGFWPDEKVDAGAWRHGSLIYRIMKWVEKKLLLHADVVVSLTRAAVAEMKQFPYLKNKNIHYVVIPTCTNLKLFCPEENMRKNDLPFTLGYIGSVGTFYLFDEVLEFYKVMIKQDSSVRFLIVNRNDHKFIDERIKALAAPIANIELACADYYEMPDQIRRMNAGVFFIKPTFSKKSSAPTRLGELLGCGVPCVVNDGIGDMTPIIEDNQVGYVMRDFSPASRERAVAALLSLVRDPSTQPRCVAAAKRHFALESGVESYRHIYQELLAKSNGVRAMSV